MKYLHGLVVTIEKRLGYTEKDWMQFKTACSEKQRELVECILDNRDVTDDDAAMIIYNTDASVESYKHLKRSLKRRLENVFLTFMPPQSSFNSFQKAYYESYQLHAAMKILSGFTRSKLAISIAEQLLQKSRKYYFNEIRAEVAIYLSRMYCNDLTRHHKAEKIGQEALKAQKIRQIEIELEYEYSKIVGAYAASQTNNHRVAQRALKIFKDYKHYRADPIESFKFYINYYLIGMIGFESKGDYEQALECCYLGLEHFLSLPFKHKSATAIFYNHIGECCIQLKRYDEASKAIRSSLDYLRLGDLVWHQSSFYLMKLNMVQGNYKEALSVWNDMKKDSQFGDIGHFRKGLFELNANYLNYLVYIGLIANDKKVNKFDVNKFDQLYPGFMSDNKGIKTTITILELLYHIADKEYDLIFVKMDRLKEYCNKKLVKKSPSYRANCFINLLLLIPVNRYNKVAIKRKAKPYLTKMAKVEAEIKEKESIAIEVIPYDKLWEIVLNFVETPKRFSKKILNQIEQLST